MKIIIKSGIAGSILKRLEKKGKSKTVEILNKALGHKYIYRFPKKHGRGWDYVYPDDLLHPIKAIKRLWGIDENKIAGDYEKNNIKKDFGADKKTFAAHVLEYFSNKAKWDFFFSKKENREKTAKPQKMKMVVGNEKIGDESGGQGEFRFEETPRKAESKGNDKPVLNRSLMRRVYGIYNKPGDEDYEREKRQDNALSGSGELPAGDPAVRAGDGEENGDQHVPGGGPAGNGGEPVQPVVDTGGRHDRDVRVTKGRAKEIREACLKLLASKTDAEMTGEDKALLRRYEGAGGLGDEDAGAHGTLYEFYTPAKVVNKVWDIVNKYAGPGKKNALEPSAGVGRFAEGRDDNFTLCELDKTSARISKILHPDAEVIQGAFQERFMQGGVAKKDYTGKKYDVVIGNPPYGAYQGLYKGRGEGKEHKRYEEYFIDRGLDTLREGGVMAFVVPSSFLRGGNSKIKEKIAAKGRLLEAWRLPNGTFNTTGIGTDIIVLRKEKGDAADFAGNAWFDKNPATVIGDEATRNGKFGPEQYVALRDGDTFDDALDRIRADAVKAIPIGDKTDAEKAKENVEIVTEKSGGEKHGNRSRVMMGNDNAKKLFFDLLNTTLRRALKYDDIKEYETTEGGTGYEAMVRTKAAARRAKTRWEKNGGYASFDESTGKLELCATPLFGQEWKYKEPADGANQDSIARPSRVLSALIPLSQLQVTRETPEAYSDSIEALNEAVKKIPKLYSGENLKEHPIALHYFTGGTDIYVTEWDGKDTFFGYTILNGDTQNAEWGYSSLSEIMSIPTMNLDYDTDMGTVEAAISKRGERESEAEAHRNRSQAMMGNENAKKDGLSDAESLKFVSQQITELEKKVKQKQKEYNDAKSKGDDITALKRMVERDEARYDLQANREKEKQLKSSSPEAGGKARKPKAATVETAPAGNIVTDSIDSFNKKYNLNIPPQSLPVWKATGWDGKIDMAALSEADKDFVTKSGNYVIDRYGSWMDKINFASGNIYRKLKQLEEDKEALGDKNYTYQKEILQSAIPLEKKIGSFVVSPISRFAKSFQVKNADGEPVGDLRDAFMKWAYNGRGRFDIDDAPISQLEIGNKITFGDIQDYIYQKPVVAERSSDAAERETNRQIAEQTRELRKEAAERIFNRFIREGLTETDQKRLENEYNRRFNAVVNPDYTRIPIFVDGIATTHHGKLLNIKGQQLKGASFLTNKGNGVIAYDVGVGKTIVGIMATVSQLQSGRAKKPLVCVPKAVYKNWIKTFRNLFPGVKINELGNLSKKYTGTGDLNIEDGTISVCTYEALQNITFRPETINGELMYDILESQETESGGKSKRRQDQENEKILTMLGVATKNKDAIGEGARFWEDMGFDHITVDEVHNFKNVFEAAKPQRGGGGSGGGDDEKEGRIANEFQGLTGSQSARGLKMFAITQLIQKNNNDRNVFALSATPFTNSPIEIYNILSLVARKKLKDMGIYNLHEFMAQFAELKTEWAVVAKGEIQRKQVMKNFQNLSALQALITEYIDKVDGEEAGIIRPRKRTHITQIGTTDLQKQIIAIETERMTKATKDDKGATLVALNNMRMAMLSPALLEPDDKYAGVNLPGPEEVVTSSPKLRFTCDSVAQCYQNNPKNSQIIYMPRGTDEYTFVKQYLVDKGIPPQAIAFMNSKTSLDAKEKIKNDFNDVNGTIKVIIGSETIKEGVSLNGNTTTLYNTCLGWNPTETIQVEGRAWRQNNKQGHVHVVYPLMNDSVDSFMYQKHSEKASRLDAIYSYKGDQLNVEDIDPEELKFALIKDPEKRAKFKIDMMKEEVENRRGTVQAQVDILVKNQKRLKQAENRIGSYDEDIADYEKELVEAKADYDGFKAEVDRDKKAKKETDWLLKGRMERAEYNVKRLKNNIRDAKNARKGEQDAIDTIRAKFDKMSIKKEADIERKTRQMLDEIKMYSEELERIGKNREKYVEEARRQIAAESTEVRPLDELITENARSIISDLRPMDEVKKEIEAERATMKKSILLFRHKAA